MIPTKTDYKAPECRFIGIEPDQLLAESGWNVTEDLDILDDGEW